MVSFEATFLLNAVRKNREEETTRNNTTEQKRFALKLAATAGIEIPEGGCRISEIKKFQEFYARRGLAIQIYHVGDIGKEQQFFYDGNLYFKSRDIENCGQLYILFHKNHHQTITSFTGVACAQYFCQYCDEGYHEIHRCPKKCIKYHKNPPCIPINQKHQKCDTRQLYFCDKACSDHHPAPNSHRVDATVLRNALG